MISRPASLLALLLVLALSPCFAQEAAAKRQRVDADTVFLGANVLPMDRERVLENHDVFVKDGRIVAVHPTRTARAGKKAQVIKAQGKYLMPGVSEMHGHYPQEADSELTQSFLFLYVANGVTLVRGMQGGPQHLPLRDAVAKGEVIGPRLLVCAPMLHGHFVRNAEKAEELVREAAKKGFDHLKVHEQLSPAVFDAIASTATEVGLEFSGHVPNEVGLWDALKKGQRTIDHLDGYVEALVEDPSRTEELGLFELGKLAGEIDEKRIASTVKATLDAGAGVVGTMELWEVLFGS
ncbi:MAG: amidohydrolase, partial [Acidobacteriota bacterium]